MEIVLPMTLVDIMFIELTAPDRAGAPAPDPASRVVKIRSIASLTTLIAER
jgi:hypothetical protein